jgi:hypothetical protein
VRSEVDELDGVIIEVFSLLAAQHTTKRSHVMSKGYIPRVLSLQIYSDYRNFIRNDPARMKKNDTQLALG